MATIVIPGGEVHSEADLHRVLAAALDFGPYYGNNLDALWDRLTTDVERPVHIVWKEAAQSRSLLGEPLFEKIVNLLRRVAAKDVEIGYGKRLTISVEE
ncbi:barstar family protein [Longispora fulva]|uniref:Ribonuclease inhibitor n=1 Tax=Longispora fulva TaxID=619741 RepID=A0A8J7GAS3_9ACTN|nr:barstar family protein [Longispora fulva]MBG6133931.1 ribonuclease inhibitor [Longispora fulva]